MRRRKRRTCPWTCHMTHSWSGKMSCGNILSGTWREKERERAQHHKALGKEESSILPKHPARHIDRTHQYLQGEPGCGNICLRLPEGTKALQRCCPTA